MSVAKTNTPAEYILASHYLSLLYGLYAELGWMAINMNYKAISRVLQKIAVGEDLAYEPPGSTKNKSKEERLFGHMTWMLFARARRNTGEHDERLRSIAQGFVEKHKVLFSEIALTWNKAEEKKAKPTVAAPGFVMLRVKP